MFGIIDLGSRFLVFLRDTLVPFLTAPIDSFSFPYLSFPSFTIQYIEIPWFFGDVTWSELILFGGLLGMLAIRLVKFFTDAIGL